MLRIRPALTLACCFILNTVSANPISIGPYTFAGSEAFPTSAAWVDGEPTYIDHPPNQFWTSVAGNTTTDLQKALAGHDVTFGIDGRTVTADLIFGAGNIVNRPGADLVVFETVFEENFDLAVFLGNSLTAPRTYWSVSTSFTIGDVVGNGNTAALNAVAIDLADFGVADGAIVNRLRLYSQPVGVPPEDSTAGADIVAIGALNIVPSPATLSLLAWGIAGFSYAQRKARSRMRRRIDTYLGATH